MPSYRPKPPSPRVRAGHPLQRGLLRFYDCGEKGGNLLRDAANGMHATLNSSPPSQWVTCPYGRAFMFIAGGNRAIASGQGLPRGSAPRTVAALFRTTSVGNRSLLSWGVQGEGSFGVAINAGALLVRHELTTVNAGSGLNDGQWHLGVLTVRPDNTIDAYADGRLVGQRTLPINTAAGDNLYIASYFLDSQTLLGDLAMLAIWDRTLTPSEVTMLDADPFGVVRPRSRLTGFLASITRPPQPPVASPRVRWFPGLRRR